MEMMSSLPREKKGKIELKNGRTVEGKVQCAERGVGWKALLSDMEFRAEWEQKLRRRGQSWNPCWAAFSGIFLLCVLDSRFGKKWEPLSSNCLIGQGTFTTFPLSPEVRTGPLQASLPVGLQPGLSNIGQSAGGTTRTSRPQGQRPAFQSSAAASLVSLLVDNPHISLKNMNQVFTEELNPAVTD